MMQQILFSLLKNTPALQELVDRRIYMTGTLGVKGVPADPQKPYIMVNELPSTPHQAIRETGRAQDRYFQLFTYDVPGSVVRINAILEVLRETVIGLVGQESPSGSRCLDAVWQGESQAIATEDESVLAKFGTLKLVSSK